MMESEVLSGARRDVARSLACTFTGLCSCLYGMCLSTHDKEAQLPARAGQPTF